MTLVPLDIEIDGQVETLQIENDPPWGEIQNLLKTCYKTNAAGQTSIDMIGFMDLILGVVVKGSSGKFNGADLTMIKKLPTSVATKLIGGVTKILPLQSYLDNMSGLQNIANQE